MSGKSWKMEQSEAVPDIVYVFILQLQQDLSHNLSPSLSFSCSSKCFVVFPSCKKSCLFWWLCNIHPSFPSVAQCSWQLSKWMPGWHFILLLSCLISFSKRKKKGSMERILSPPPLDTMYWNVWGFFCNGYSILLLYSLTIEKIKKTTGNTKIFIFLISNAKQI